MHSRSQQACASKALSRTPAHLRRRRGDERFDGELEGVERAGDEQRHGHDGRVDFVRLPAVVDHHEKAAHALVARVLELQRDEEGRTQAHHVGIHPEARPRAVRHGALAVAQHFDERAGRCATRKGQQSFCPSQLHALAALEPKVATTPHLHADHAKQAMLVSPVSRILHRSL